MKRISTYLLLFLFIMAIISCDDEEDHNPDIPNVEADPLSLVEFDNLQAGDIMTYLYLKGGICIDQEGCEFMYTGDTLELKVIGKTDKAFLIQERITPGSATFIAENPYIWNADKILELLWEIREDSIIITPSESNENHESFIIQRQGFPLKEITENQVEFNGWSTTLPFLTGKSDFHIKDGELLGNKYPHLNGRVDNYAMIVDGSGCTHIYNKENGFVRVTSISAWTSRGNGWDRLK